MENTQQETNQTPQGSKQKSQVDIIALISYIGVLCVVPLFVKSQDEFVKFHAKQGLILFIGEVATYILSLMTPFLVPLWFLVNLGWLILSIFGIINVVKNEKKQLPIIGQFADKIKI
jgi:fumarate reductase subunit D